RAAFLLHDVFDMDYSAVATAIDRTEAACRQLAARAREHVRSGPVRYEPGDEEARRIADAFVVAAASGDTGTFAQLLADDAGLSTDGGGKRQAALNPIYGKEKISRFYDGIRRRGGIVEPQAASFRMETPSLNGLPGFVFHTAEGTETMAVEVRDGKVTTIYIVRNPDKVRHLA